MSGAMQDCYFQYGCGLSAPAGWLNYDASPTLKLQRLPVLGGVFRARVKPLWPRNVLVGDIRRNFPVPDGSAAGAYCSHVLEHLSLEDCRLAIRNTYRALRPGGRFRLVMPDLAECVRMYTQSSDPGAALAFMRSTHLGEERRARGLNGLLRSWLGHSAHRWLWDYPSIEVELLGCGFEGVRRAQCGDSEDPRFAEVEDKDRWEGGLGVECMRPAADKRGR